MKVPMCTYTYKQPDGSKHLATVELGSIDRKNNIYKLTW